MDVSTSGDALRAAIFVFVFNVVRPSHAMMASSLLIQVKHEHIDIISRSPQS
jgi:hypothetical protein